MQAEQEDTVLIVLQAIRSAAGKGLCAVAVLALLLVFATGFQH